MELCQIDGTKLCELTDLMKLTRFSRFHETICAKHEFCAHQASPVRLIYLLWPAVTTHVTLRSFGFSDSTFLPFRRNTGKER
jgi:hypothetical protein